MGLNFINKNKNYLYKNKLIFLNSRICFPIQLSTILHIIDHIYSEIKVIYQMVLLKTDKSQLIIHKFHKEDNIFNLPIKSIISFNLIDQRFRIKKLSKVQLEDYQRYFYGTRYLEK